jgi:hypothetical protein
MAFLSPETSDGICLRCAQWNEAFVSLRTDRIIRPSPKLSFFLHSRLSQADRILYSLKVRQGGRSASSKSKELSPRTCPRRSNTTSWIGAQQSSSAKAMIVASAPRFTKLVESLSMQMKPTRPHNSRKSFAVNEKLLEQGRIALATTTVAEEW